jgi:hypothetical protein
MSPPFRLSVACASAAACLVVGSYDTASNNLVGLLISGAASSWSVSVAPVPSNAAGPRYALEQAVACAKSASACVAVGYYRDKSGNDQGLLLTGPP